MREPGDNVVILARQHIFLVQADLIETPLRGGARECAVSCYLDCYDTFSDILDQRPVPLHALERAS